MRQRMLNPKTFILLSPSQQAAAQAFLANLPLDADEPLEVVVRERQKPRSQAQNAFSHAWYGEIAQALPEDDALGWKCYCKLHHGVPILRAEDDAFREAYDGSIKPLPYEKKLLAMRVFPVTSRMNTRQLTKYADAVRDDFAARGVLLEVRGG
ncbi:NinB domain protein [Bordetella bronchiseptica OSU095]|uniref:recombination protein NinB n=1 Tax=Bordetella bronchiseptica TaxID=518 RepID=UPI00049FD060|nr:recombination protein NinB [Bordetella bronchiseptica]KDD44697.1 NinB domain protein [Bordetella bronchiseptica OSU095]